MSTDGGAPLHHPCEPLLQPLFAATESRLQTTQEKDDRETIDRRILKLEPVHLNVSTPEEVPLLRYRVEVGRAPVNFLPLFSSMDTDSL